MTNYCVQSSANADASQIEILADYRRKHEAFEAKLVDLRLQESRALTVLIAAILLFVVSLSIVFGSGHLPLASSAIPLIGILLTFRHYQKVKEASLNLARRFDFYGRGINRLTGAWQGTGITGQEYAQNKHLYQLDLDIIGENSLFELLCTTRSEIGAERLAYYLLGQAELEEVRQRQSAVKELKNAAFLREEIALLGNYTFQDCSRQRLHDWLDMPILKVHRAVAIFLFASSPICAGLGILGLTTLVGWSTLAPFLIPLAVVQTGIAAILCRQVRPLLKVLETLTNEFVILRQGLELMERQQFQSPKLQLLVQQVHDQAAFLQIQKLERLVSRVNYRKIDTVFLPSLFFAMGTQLILAVERWRAEYQNDLAAWLDCWAEFEALNALAGYAHEHPANEFPELVEGSTIFNAEKLGHPLLAEDVCVRNDVLLNETSRFYLISGSNMAGKSTLLRSIGMNAVLASAGAPICAVNVCMSVFRVCASISITDSISEGKSKFLAEVERLKETIGAMQENKSVLFLIDEILGGTNSKDRRMIAESIMETLIAGGAVGALSTHDLALCEIADIRAFHGVNLHMESENPDDPLDFDYRVKAGISQRSNALAIVKMMGIGTSSIAVP